MHRRHHVCCSHGPGHVPSLCSCQIRDRQAPHMTLTSSLLTLQSPSAGVRKTVAGLVAACHGATPAVYAVNPTHLHRWRSGTFVAERCRHELPQFAPHQST